MEGLWIHRALNVSVNDQSQLAELEKRGWRRGDRVMDKEKYRSEEESRRRGGGNIFSLMFPFPQPQFAAINHQYSALIKAIHHIDLLPLPSKAKITQSSSDGRGLALEGHSVQQWTGGRAEPQSQSWEGQAIQAWMYHLWTLTGEMGWTNKSFGTGMVGAGRAPQHAAKVMESSPKIVQMASPFSPWETFSGTFENFRSFTYLYSISP